ncbi:MAG TPA: trehalose-6-phosphate synthase [Steroidobacter sp.]|uniref:alpha,alpha-trehalose-phosphate synthase (UDP-forming) n=1 Tax=Steroidobacter sp. TaxID=1978227 RepID=UPI002EDA8701
MKSRLVCVSNRVTLPRKVSAPGGLTVGILGALKRTGGLWFGWGGELTDGDPGPAEILTRDGIAFATVPVQQQLFDLYYNGFANESLWPLFHYMPSRFRFRPQEWAAYEQVNRQFAQALLPLLKEDDCIWVHDYHLIPLARYLREMGVRVPIGFFLHIPFPYIETLRVLPTYAELMRDLVAYDLVGFQTDSDLNCFLSAVVAVFGERVVEDHCITVGNHSARCGVFPIGVDVDAIQKTVAASQRSEPVRRMVESLLGRKLVIGVDRLDYSKGLVERFAAYEQFLETFPHNCGRITYLQIAPLSRKDVTSYAEIRRKLEQAAGRTNGRFAETDWTPIRYLNRNFPHDVLMGFLRAAQVALVTPLRDGMNLVAKEYLAAQDEDDPGVLVLSNLAGAARELTAALQINPYDPQALGHALQTALTMSLGERRERHRQLMQNLREHSINAWASEFVAALRSPISAPEVRAAS